VSLVAAGLVQDFRGENLLAQEIESPDSKIWRIKIRPNVRFHDGTVVMADDVLNSFELVRKAPADSALSDRFKEIRSIRKLSPLEVEVSLSETMPVFRKYLTFGILPAKLFPAANASPGDFLRHPVGAGPFRLVQYGEREPSSSGLTTISRETAVEVCTCENDSVDGKGLDRVHPRTCRSRAL